MVYSRLATDGTMLIISGLIMAAKSFTHNLIWHCQDKLNGKACFISYSNWASGDSAGMSNTLRTTMMTRMFSPALVCKSFTPVIFHEILYAVRIFNSATVASS
jgi:hypothetical protein